MNIDPLPLGTSDAVRNVSVVALRDTLTSKCQARQIARVVGLAGASGAGKTWLARRICAELGESVVRVLELDRYYRNLDVVDCLQYRHDNPDALDWAHATADIDALMNCRQRFVPVYDFAKHRRTGCELLQPAPLLVVEGHLLLCNQSVKNRCDVTIWIDAKSDRCFERRMRRDCDQRGDNMSDALSRYKEEVQPSSERYLLPSRSSADLIVVNDQDDLQAAEGILNMMKQWI